MANRKCPRCGSDLERIRRRLLDRLTSLFRPVSRYRCPVVHCGWEGTLPRERERAKTP